MRGITLMKITKAQLISMVEAYLDRKTVGTTYPPVADVFIEDEERGLITVIFESEEEAAPDGD